MRSHHLAAALASALLVSGCTFLEKEKNNLEEWWQEETGVYHHAKSQKAQNRLFHSRNPQDYILPDGSGMAIPAKLSYDLWISPFAPQRYFRCKEPEGTIVICPYSGRRLELGRRSKIAEKETP